mgnify:CR=1 FL=1
MTGRRTLCPALGAVLALTLGACAGPMSPASDPTGSPTATESPASVASPSTPSAPGTPSAASSSVAAPADPDGSPAIAALAVANLGKTAGTCARTPTRNSLGGTAFEHSCKGWNDVPEYWCADFAIWVWRNAGYDVSGLDAASISFATYGVKHHSTRAAPKVGDALVFNKTMSTTWAAHVAIVTAIDPDGSVVLVNGDWAGESGSEVHFATTASVKATTIPGAQAVVGGGPIDVQGGIQVIAIVAPVKKG